MPSLIARALRRLRDGIDAYRIELEAEERAQEARRRRKRREKRAAGMKSRGGGRMEEKMQEERRTDNVPTKNNADSNAAPWVDELVTRVQAQAKDPGSQIEYLQDAAAKLLHLCKTIENRTVSGGDAKQDTARELLERARAMEEGAGGRQGPVGGVGGAKEVGKLPERLEQFAAEVMDDLRHGRLVEVARKAQELVESVGQGLPLREQWDGGRGEEMSPFRDGSGQDFNEDLG